MSVRGFLGLHPYGYWILTAIIAIAWIIGAVAICCDLARTHHPGSQS